MVQKGSESLPYLFRFVSRDIIDDLRDGFLDVFPRSLSDGLYLGTSLALVGFSAPNVPGFFCDFRNCIDKNVAEGMPPPAKFNTAFATCFMIKTGSRMPNSKS